MTPSQLKNLVGSVNALHGEHEGHVLTGATLEGLHVACGCGVDLVIRRAEKVTAPAMEAKTEMTEQAKKGSR